MARTSKAKEDLIGLRVTEGVKWLDAVLWANVVVGVSIVLGKLFGVTEFKWQEVDLKVEWAWLVFLILAVAHLYCTVLLVRALKPAAVDLPEQVRKNLFDTVTATGGPFLRGLMPRISPEHLQFQKSISPADLSGWTALVGAVLIVVAVVPFALDKWTIAYFYVGSLLAYGNWVIGSHWAFALSDLTLPRPHYLAGWRPSWDQYILATVLRPSGYTSPRPVSWVIQIVWTVLSAGPLVLLSIALSGSRFISRIMRRLR